MIIYELWASHGDYSDYTEYRLGTWLTQEELDAAVERMMAMDNIEQAEPTRKNAIPETYMVMKNKNNMWSGIVSWTQHWNLYPHFRRNIEMQIWSNTVVVGEDNIEETLGVIY